jgi:OOP family OmpA-OmpF porin
MVKSDQGSGRGRVGVVLGALALGVGLAGCATQPPESLESAEAAVSNARSDTEIQRLAADELAAAEQALQRAEAAWENDASDEEIEHLAYVTERRVAIARAAAEEEQSEEAIAQLIEERDGVQLEARERDVDVAEREAQLAERRAEEAETELEQLQRELEAKETERGLVLTLGDILFDVDQAELKPGGIQQLTRVADFLSEQPERKLVIEGHTDSTASDEYNRELSQRRANAVEEFLITQGIEPTRMEARGYGEAFPVATNETTAGRQQNRRVEIVILDEGEALPPPRVSQR